MKKILFFITTIILLTNIIVYSQTMSYSFTQSSTSYSSIGTGTSPGASFTGVGIATNAVSAAITLPFAFTFNGVAETQIIISNNGFITFGATAPTTTNYNPISATTSYGGAIAGYGFNLVNSPVVGATPDITYTTIGSSPSRTFIVEFKDLGRTGITGDRMNFQIRLSETTNEINIVYGTWAATTTTTAVADFGMVGLRGSANTFYNARQVNTATPHNTWATSGSAANNGLVSWQTQGVLGSADGPNNMRYNSTFLPTSGQVYTWTPIATSFYQSIPYTQNFETWSDLFAKNDKAGNGILSHPSSGNSSWRNYNESTTNSYWSSPNGRPYLGVGQGTGAASFYNYGAAIGRKGYLDFYLNLSASGSKVLTFDLINEDPGTLNVRLSTDGGVTFSGLTGFTTTSLTSWATQTVTIGSTTSSTCVLRFVATSTLEIYNIGIDNINVFNPALPTITSYIPNTNLCTEGGQTVTITGANFTGATQVQFNGTNASSYSVVSATSITAVTPSSLTAGNITVTTGDGTATSTAYTVLPRPTKPILNVDSVYLCNGTVQPLVVTNGAKSGSTSDVRNSLGKTITDTSATGVFDSINVSGVPAGAIIDSIVVNLRYSMTFDGDLEVNLQAPNGQILNLIADNGGLDDDFTNTRISSNLSNPLLPTSSGSGGAPFTGTYRPTAATTGLIATTNLPTTTNFNNLFSTPNGLWICRTYDDGSGNIATWNNWRLFIYYTMPSTSWSPSTGLYSNSGATTSYTTGDSTTVYAKPTMNTDYIVTSSYANGCSNSDTAKYVLKSSSSSVALFNSSTNASPLTLDCEDGTWTYYADPSNNNRWLFAIDWDTNLVAKSTAQIQLIYNTSGIKSDIKLRSGSSADYDGSFIMNKYWNVNNASLNPGSNPVKIRYFYDPSDITNATSMMTDSLNKYQSLSPGGNTYYSTGWKWFKTVGIPFTPALINDGNNFGFAHLDLNPTSTGTINGVTYVEFDTITSFSGGSGGVGFTPHAGVGLPVTLLNFKGDVKESSNFITWSTASEINNHHFELESSVDGIQFTKIATLAGHGTTTTTNNYSFNDFKYNMPATYYRLKQVDNDGKENVTNMIILSRKSSSINEAVVSVYPNPTNEFTTLIIDVQENAEAIYTVYDVTGKIVAQGNVTCTAGNNNTQIQTNQLADGVYVVDVLINGKHINTRVVKSSN